MTELIAPLRQALSEIPGDVAHHGPSAPPLEQVFIVPGHLAALDPDNLLVVGDRGVGKSFWSACLNSAQARRLIDAEVSRHRLDEFEVSWGYSTAATSTADHPSKRVLLELVRAGFDPQSIWRTVILHQLGRYGGKPIPGSEWSERVSFVAESAQREERHFDAAIGGLNATGKRHLIVFDALDRMGDSWQEIRALVQGLLQVCLDLRSNSSLRIKLFMRSDMWADRRIWEFRDAAKLSHARVVLQWKKVDLYGLLWHWLANHPASGNAFRDWCRLEYQQAFEPISIDEHVVHSTPRSLRVDEDLQAEVFSRLASPFMGRDRRRGRTYSWLPNHLSDAKGQISPRSFLVALRGSVPVSAEKTTDLVLHFEGIKNGVQQASEIRIAELGEDYPWIRILLQPLEGMSVPCETHEVFLRWRNADVQARIRDDVLAARPRGIEYLPPDIDLEKGGEGDSTFVYEELLRLLGEIGIVSIGTNRRLNMPDLFRVAGGIGRRGGVKAIR